MKIFIIILIVFSIVLMGCSSTNQKPTVYQTQIIKCTNLIFDCSDDDCGKVCGKLTSESSKYLASSRSVNNGQGCECTYSG